MEGVAVLSVLAWVGVVGGLFGILFVFAMTWVRKY